MTIKVPTVKQMFEKGVHIGHRTQKWNPRAKRYLYGEKDGIHLINLEKTVDALDKAVEFVSKLSSEGKNVLFVSTKPQSITFLREAAESCKMPYVVSKWIPGLITNFSTLKTRIRHLAKLKEDEVSGGFEKYTKKEAIKLKKEIDKLQIALGGVEDMNSLPDAVFVIDVVRDKIVVTEARKAGIPVIGIVDSNADPSDVDFPIPGNDDALASLELIIGAIVEAYKSSSKSKK